MWRGGRLCVRVKGCGEGEAMCQGEGGRLCARVKGCDKGEVVCEVKGCGEGGGCVPG